MAGQGQPWPGTVGAEYTDRLGVIYVRQSTMRQVAPHTESLRVQYGLVDRAIALGWTRERVKVIDADLGMSGATAEGRPGFAELVSEVGLGHVGIVPGAEVSRLARSGRDWYQLMEPKCTGGNAVGRQRRGLRSGPVQRSAVAGVEGHHVGGGTAPDRAADGVGAPGQGPPRGVVLRGPDRICAPGPRGRWSPIPTSRSAP